MSLHLESVRKIRFQRRSNNHLDPYKVAKSRETRTLDLTDVSFVKDLDGYILTGGSPYEQGGKVGSNCYSV